MALRQKSSNRDIPPAITEIVRGIAERYDISAEFQKVIEEQATAAMSGSKMSLSARFKKGGLFGIAKDVLDRGTKNKLDNTPVAQQTQSLQGLNSEKVKLILQGLTGLGNLLKGSANLTSVKSAAAATSKQTPVLSTTPTTVASNTTLKTPLKKEEKDFIKDKEPQVVILGGITNDGVTDLQRKVPIILKDVLSDLKKSLKSIKSSETKPSTAASTSGEGGGLLDSILKGGVLGTALDFLRRRKGTFGGRASRNRRAKQLRSQRAARKTAAPSTRLKTPETPKPVILKDGTPEAKAARSARAQELRAERAARKAATGTTLKTAEKEAAKTAASTTLKTAEKGASKVAGKAVAKGAGKALLKSGLKKIPILGALAGLGFGAQRAIQGDWLGAAGEVASGAAGSIPGLGTAASVGIDAALAARDISKEMNQPEASSDKIKEVPSTSAKPIDSVQPFKEGNQDLKPIGTPPTPSTAATTENNPNKDVLAKIAENTNNTNSSIGALIQAIYKLAQAMGTKTGAPPIIVNSGQQRQDVGPSASQVAAANNDPIRTIRSQFAL